MTLLVCGVVGAAGSGFTPRLYRDWIFPAYLSFPPKLTELFILQSVQGQGYQSCQKSSSAYIVRHPLRAPSISSCWKLQAFVCYTFKIQFFQSVAWMVVVLNNIWLTFTILSSNSDQWTLFFWFWTKPKHKQSAKDARQPSWQFKTTETEDKHWFQWATRLRKGLSVIFYLFD